jgi:hypothetical protein
MTPVRLARLARIAGAPIPIDAATAFLLGALL